MDKKYTVTVSMKPVCECGYIFKVLHYNIRNKVFAPSVCPNCGCAIETFTINDLTKFKPDADNNICICESDGDCL